jgi:hypothetical protein
MPNNFINTDWVSSEILRLLLNKLVCSEYFSHDHEKDFEKEFAVGSTVRVKFPWRPSTIDGMGYIPQAVDRIFTTVSLDQWIQLPFEWDDYERAVKLERSESELRENYWDPCAAAMAQEWDSRCAQWAYQHASQVVGALGTDNTTVQTFYQARQALMEMACPPGKRAMLISSSQMTTLGSNITNLFHPADELDKMFKEGSIGKLAGFNFFESNSLYSHTAGTWAGAVTVTGANQSGTSLIITGGAGDTLFKGDKFSILNVNKVNPMTKRVPGVATAKTFTVMNDYTLTGGADTIGILPAIYGPSSAYQNVTALPATGAALTLWPGTVTPSAHVGTVGLGLSKFAFMLVGAKLYVPKAVESAGQAQDPASGLAIRKVQAWDPTRSMNVNRMDSLGGFGDGYQDSGAVCVAMG